MKRNRHITKAYFSPARLFLVVAVSVFLIEAMVMIILPRLPVLSETTAALLDSTTLVILLSPILYFFLFRPLLGHINERRAAEAELVIERDRAQSYLDVAGVIIVALDENGNVLLINKKGCEILGHEEYDILGKNWFANFVPDALWGMGKMADVFKKTAETHPDYFENPIFTKQGGQRHILWRYAPLIKNNAIKGILYSGEDITERKRVEKALIESEMHYRLVHNSAFDGIIISSMDDRVLDSNLSAENIFGYEKGELIGLQITSLMPPHYRQRHMEGLKKFLVTGISRIQGKPMELEGLKKDGSIFPMEFTLSIFYMEGSVRFNGTIRDITERKRAERDRERMQAQINQSQKIEAVGRLAGGIAHDFNNILTTIEGNAELALEDMRPPRPALPLKGLSPLEEGGKMEKAVSGPVRARLDEIILSVKHASKLTRQLLLFSRGHPVEIIPLNINSVIEDVIAMLKRLIGEDIKLATELAQDIWIIEADESSMEQVLLNLTVNARDAMPKGGSLFITTSNVLLDEDRGKWCEGLPSGKYISLVVKDSGRGMEKEIIPRIFEPFFTTKDTNKGTGLGLAVIYGIVKQHGGCITVDSVPNGGTTFTILLPVLTKFNKKPVKDSPAREIPL